MVTAGRGPPLLPSRTTMSTKYKITTPKNRAYFGRQYGVAFSRGEGVGTQAQAEYLRDTFGYDVEPVEATEAEAIETAVAGTRLGSVPPTAAPAGEGKAVQIVDPETQTAPDGTRVVVEGEEDDTEPDALTRIKGVGPATATAIGESLVPTLDALATVDAEVLAAALADKGLVGITPKVIEGWKAQAQTIVESA